MNNPLTDQPTPEKTGNAKWQTPKEKAVELAKTMQCNCDLDNWQPENITGHSWVCRIHKAALVHHPIGVL